jgi:hypothetical protein
MRTTTLVCLAAVLAMLAFQSSPGGVAPAPTSVETLPFGILIRGAACEAATHTLLNPCSNSPTAFVVFKKNMDVTPLEGKNVKMRGMLDQTSCSLTLIRATKIAESTVLPPCPPPQCNPGDPPPCPLP